jgi:alpha-tubulin suppressor-like RCC1 family protein
MGRPISYEMQMMFVGSSGAFEESMNTGSGISRLDFIQGYDFSFNIERTPLKQIGSDSFATRQTQLAPDVNLNIQYYLNDGWNDKYIGLDIQTGTTGNPFNSILSSTGDRNFYISIAQNDGIDQNLQTGIVNSNILAIGNAYITNYEISVAVNQLATVSCSFVGANANVQDYATSKYLPSVNTLVSGQNAQDANKNFSLNFVNNSRTERYLPKTKEVFNGGCPYSKCKITPDFQSGGGTSPITFGFFDTIANNFQSMQFSVQFERKALYGFGNNHPYIRKIQRPTVATLSLSALIDDFQAENLSKVFHAEGGIKSSMLIEFFNLEDVKKFGLSLQSLTLESYNLGARIGDRVLVETNWTVEVKNGVGADIGMVGSYGPPLLDVTKVNESFAVERVFFQAAASDGGQAFGVDKNGTLWGWGVNTYWRENFRANTIDSLEGQVATPIKIIGANRKFYKVVSKGGGFSAIDQKGKVWSWGDNSYGQIGDGSTTSRTLPTSLYGNKTFCEISGSLYKTVGLDKGGKLWAWGRLSESPATCSSTPVAIYQDKTFCKISNASHFIDKNGKAWAWGYPNPTAAGGNKTFSEISAAGGYTLAIDKYGKAWGWGYNGSYHIGSGSNTPSFVNSNSPIAVYGTKTFCKIFANDEFNGIPTSFAIDKYGKAWGWGDNGYGQLGDNSTVNRCTPVAVCGNKIFSNIYVGYTTASWVAGDDIPRPFVIGIDNNNIAWSWGSNLAGVLGNGNKTYHCVPVLVNSATTFCKIATNAHTSLTLDKNGLAQYSGLTNIYGNKNVCEIGVSIDSYYIIDNAGKAWAWGSNEYGQLGDNSVTSRVTPVQVYGSKTFCKIIGNNTAYYGDKFAVAIDKYNKAWAWGINTNGQLGNNSVTSRRTPVAVLGNKTFCQISAGYGHVLAIDKNGKVWGWGDNSSGQLGNNSTTPRSSPVAVYGNKTFCKIFASDSLSVAIDKDNKLWGWGYGQYLITDNQNFLTPKRLTIGSLNNNFCDAAIGGVYGSYMFLDTDGKAWGWGSNICGLLGLNTNAFIPSPRQICGNNSFYKIGIISSEFDGACYAIDKSNRLWGWGNIGGYTNNSNYKTPSKIYNQ